MFVQKKEVFTIFLVFVFQFKIVLLLSFLLKKGVENTTILLFEAEHQHNKKRVAAIFIFFLSFQKRKFDLFKVRLTVR